MTELQKKLLTCASSLRYTPHGCWETLVDEVEHPRWGDGTGLTWESWIPRSLAAIWSDLPLEAKIATYLTGCSVAKFAADRSC